MQVKIALAGNPGCGKTTLFYVLTGDPKYAENRAGVTVEKKEGWMKGEEDILLVDLPGLSSLSPYTLNEVIARNCLVNENPDAILNVIDGTRIERSLFLTTQLTELGIPLVLAVSKSDLVRERSGPSLCRRLEEYLGCRTISVSVREKEHCAEAVRAAAGAARERMQPPLLPMYGENVSEALREIRGILRNRAPERLIRWYGIKVFERNGRVLEALGLTPAELERVDALVRSVEEAEGDDAESVLTNQRYEFIASVMEKL